MDRNEAAARVATCAVIAVMAVIRTTQDYDGGGDGEIGDVRDPSDGIKHQPGPTDPITPGLEPDKQPGHIPDPIGPVARF